MKTTTEELADRVGSKYALTLCKDPPHIGHTDCGLSRCYHTNRVGGVECPEAIYMDDSCKWECVLVVDATKATGTPRTPPQYTEENPPEEDNPYGDAAYEAALIIIVKTLGDFDPDTGMTLLERAEEIYNSMDEPDDETVQTPFAESTNEAVRQYAYNGCYFEEV